MPSSKSRNFIKQDTFNFKRNTFAGNAKKKKKNRRKVFCFLSVYLVFAINMKMKKRQVCNLIKLLSMQICLIFNDGKDDREALAVTNRMRLTEKRISLTIIRFIPKISEIENQYLGENFQMVSLKETVTNIIGFDVKENDDYVTYIDTTVSDGSETSKILRSMANDYDLFVVGRSSGVGTEVTNGISEWAEFDELGPIGDLLASHEFPSRASVLVVQKQEYIHSAKSKRGLSKS